jgi:hypothetical protein
MYLLILIPTHIEQVGITTSDVFFFWGEVLQPCEEKKWTLATITKALFWEKMAHL